MQFYILGKPHVGQNRKLCLSTHGRLPGTLQYSPMHVYTCTYEVAAALQTRKETYFIVEGLELFQQCSLSLCTS